MASLRNRTTAAFAAGILAMAGGNPAEVSAETVARLAAATDGDPASSPPGPFTVLPGGRRIAIHAPAARGLLVLEGTRLLAHLPLPPGVPVHDLAAAGNLLVAGTPQSDGYLTIRLSVFDLGSKELVSRVESANPFLQLPSELLRDWRVIAEPTVAGVFHPPTAASYPLWDREGGLVSSSEQISRANAGVGLAGDERWVPQPDGRIDRRIRGRTVSTLGAGHGRFVGAFRDGTLFTRRDRSDDRPEDVLPSEIILDAFRGEEAVGAVHLRARARGLSDERASFRGRPVILRDHRIYWVYADHDGLEIRTIEPRVALPKGE